MAKKNVKKETVKLPAHLLIIAERMKQGYKGISITSDKGYSITDVTPAGYGN